MYSTPYEKHCHSDNYLTTLLRRSQYTPHYAHRHHFHLVFPLESIYTPPDKCLIIRGFLLPNKKLRHFIVVLLSLHKFVYNYFHLGNKRISSPANNRNLPFANYFFLYVLTLEALHPNYDISFQSHS